nr:MAG TPA: hypothetical protein [Caudoviricetes sp.]
MLKSARCYLIDFMARQHFNVTPFKNTSFLLSN